MPAFDSQVLGAKYSNLPAMSIQSAIIQGARKFDSCPVVDYHCAVREKDTSNSSQREVPPGQPDNDGCHTVRLFAGGIILSLFFVRS